MTQHVELQTNHGTIRIELDDAKAPESVRNFISYVEKGHYDGTVFHRVIKGFMVQGGGFEPGMKQKPTDAPIQNEASNGLKNAHYTLAMARTSARSCCARAGTRGSASSADVASERRSDDVEHARRVHFRRRARAAG